MAAGYLCDAGDSLPGAYLITDLVTGDTAAWCGAHFADLCAAVTRAAEAEIAAEPETVVAQDVDSPVDGEPPAPPPGNSADVPHVGGLAIDEPRGFSDETVEPAMTDGPMVNPSPEVVIGGAPKDEPAHRERTKHKLAQRPDSAKTSAETIPEPGPPRR